MNILTGLFERKHVCVGRKHVINCVVFREDVGRVAISVLQLRAILYCDRILCDVWLLARLLLLHTNRDFYLLFLLTPYNALMNQLVKRRYIA